MADALPSTAQIGVIGAGAMGAGIAQIAAQAGHRVCLFDTRMGAADQAKAAIGETLAALAAKGKIDGAAADAAASRIHAVHALGDLVSARLVVEAIVEDLAVKRTLLRELEVVVSPDAILATNTSSLSITALAAGMKHPGRVVGMHFFNPAPLMPLVEVVSGLATDAEVANTAYATALAWGKSPVHARSTPGFIVNRCARPFYAEALRVLAECAADPATLDAIMREAGGFRMGPFELMDLIGLDVNIAVTRSVWEAFFHDPRFTPSVTQQEMVAAGYLGRKAGRGFYDYGANAAKPAPSTEPAQPRPGKIARLGELRMGAELAARLGRRQASAIDVAIADARFPRGALHIGKSGRRRVAGSRRRPDRDGDGGGDGIARCRDVRPGLRLRPLHAPRGCARGHLQRRGLCGGGGRAAGGRHRGLAHRRRRGADRAAHRGHAGERGGRRRDAGHCQRRGCRHRAAEGRQLSARAPRVGRRAGGGLRPRHAAQSRRRIMARTATGSRR